MAYSDLLEPITRLLLFALKRKAALLRGSIDYFDEIADALEKVVEGLSAGQPTPEACAALDVQVRNLSTVLEPVLKSGLVDPQDVERLRQDLYAFIDAPIAATRKLSKSRWVILGSLLDPHAPLVVGTRLLEGEHLPVQISTSTPDFPERLAELRANSEYTIYVNPETALNEELMLLREGTGRFRAVASTLRTISGTSGGDVSK